MRASGTGPEEEDLFRIRIIQVVSFTVVFYLVIKVTIHVTTLHHFYRDVDRAEQNNFPVRRRSRTVSGVRSVVLR